MFPQNISVVILLKSSKSDIINALKTIKSLFAQSCISPKVVLSLAGEKNIATEVVLPEEMEEHLGKNLFIEHDNASSLKDIFKGINNQVLLTVESGAVYPKKWLYCVLTAYLNHKDIFVITKFDMLEEVSDEILFKDFAIIELDATGKLSVLKSREIIVSLTTYPPRIHSAVLSLKTIYKQTKLPDKVILWLALSDFPNKMEDLPAGLRRLAAEKNLSIRWCEEDLKPHKKYFWAFKEYPDALIITVDDDVIYPAQRIENLYLSYLLHPRAVSAARACLVPLSKDGEIPPYGSWPAGIDAFVSTPSLQLCATGVGGVLYPTGLFSGVWELLDMEVIKRTCLYEDDLWLKAMEIVAGIPVVVAEGFDFLTYTPNSQEIGLYHENLAGRSDKQLILIQREIDRRYGENFFLKKLMDPTVGENLVGVKVLADLIKYYQRKVRRLKRECVIKSLPLNNI